MLTDEQRERRREYHRQYKRDNPEIVKAQKLRWRKKNAERIAENTRRWKKENPEKVALDKELRYTRAKNARVKWDSDLTELVMTEAIDLRKLRERHTGIRWHIDHIIPLKGKTVCGLHVWNNLRVIPASVNIAKKNKFDESLLT